MPAAAFRTRLAAWWGPGQPGAAGGRRGGRHEEHRDVDAAGQSASWSRAPRTRPAAMNRRLHLLALLAVGVLGLAALAAADRTERCKSRRIVGGAVFGSLSLIVGVVVAVFPLLGFGFGPPPRAVAPSPCITQNNLNGTCSSRRNCAGVTGGVPAGDCARGLGVCCVGEYIPWGTQPPTGGGRTARFHIV